MFSVWSILRSEISRYASLNFISVSANSFLKCWITSVNFSISVSFSCSSLFMWTSGPSCCRKKKTLRKKHWVIIFHRLSLQDFDYKIPPSLGQVERKCYDLDLWPKTWFKVTTCPLPTGTLSLIQTRLGWGWGEWIMDNLVASNYKQTDRQLVNTQVTIKHQQSTILIYISFIVLLG